MSEPITFVLGPYVQRFAAVDLTGPDGIATFLRLAGQRRIDVVYSDPPWNPGNEKYWRRHASASATRGYDALLDAWGQCASRCGASDIFCEQSVIDEHRDLFLAATRRCSTWTLPLLEQWTVQYGSPKRPNVLLHFGRQPIATDPSGMSGQSMTMTVLRGLPLVAYSRLIADPCMGLGTTSRIAHALGLDCVGTELNPARLARTMAWLERQGYVRS